jgi:hypothetical protein
MTLRRALTLVALLAFILGGPSGCSQPEESKLKASEVTPKIHALIDSFAVEIAKPGTTPQPSFDKNMPCSDDRDDPYVSPTYIVDITTRVDAREHIEKVLVPRFKADGWRTDSSESESAGSFDYNFIRSDDYKFGITMGKTTGRATVSGSGPCALGVAKN